MRTQPASAAAAESSAREALAALHAADEADRSRSTEAERAAAAARDHLRTADDRLRAADHADLEARLGLDSLREGVLVELAGMGPLGLVSRRGVQSATPRPTRSVSPSAMTTPNGGDRDEDTAALNGPSLPSPGVGPTNRRPQPRRRHGRLAQLRRRYHELGAANPFAVDEYAELKTRLETLEAQGSDLHSAIDKTRDLIAELDTMIADRFRTTFRALESAFDGRFEQLFGGGFARLSLTDPSDLGSTGIEIVARPPGKKAQALAMLSGGERALTAVALLFAMLEVRPVPFCVLDEVDAALDEANIGRFADALRSLAHQTQFIVITHNRGTIEAADALYGVTVGDDSVSRVISLRLDEAQALAAERGANAARGGLMPFWRRGRDSTEVREASLDRRAARPVRAPVQATGLTPARMPRWARRSGALRRAPPTASSSRASRRPRVGLGSRRTAERPIPAPDAAELARPASDRGVPLIAGAVGRQRRLGQSSISRATWARARGGAVSGPGSAGT